MRLLRYGSSGPSVQLLQLALNRAGYGQLDTDGQFGRATEAALRSFQAASGIGVDGIAGPRTHRAILPWYLGYILHRVQPGDSVYLLARRYGSSQEAIFLANPGLEPLNLQPGQELVVPFSKFPMVSLRTPTNFAKSSCFISYLARYSLILFFIILQPPFFFEAVVSSR